MFQGFFQDTSMVFQERFKKVLSCNFLSSQLPEQKKGLFTCLLIFLIQRCHHITNSQAAPGKVTPHHTLQSAFHHSKQSRRSLQLVKLFTRVFLSIVSLLACSLLSKFLFSKLRLCNLLIMELVDTLHGSCIIIVYQNKCRGMSARVMSPEETQQRS